MSTLLEVRTTIVLTAVGVDKTLKMWKNKYFPIQYFLIQISSRKKYLTITKLTCGLANNFFFFTKQLNSRCQKGTYWESHCVTFQKIYKLSFNRWLHWGFSCVPCFLNRVPKFATLKNFLCSKFRNHI